jgi:hypothetical protein
MKVGSVEWMGLRVLNTVEGKLLFVEPPSIVGITVSLCESVADIDETAGLERELPHTEARRCRAPDRC